MSTNHETKQILVVGRAGNLTKYANPLTFDLLEKIFGNNGPYRKGLMRFGVICKSEADGFLVNVNGKVYSDMNKENEAIWGNYPFYMELNDNKLVIKQKWVPFSFKKLWNFLRKSVTETNILTKLKRTEVIADDIYTGFSSAVDKTFETSRITSEKFLSLYQSLIEGTYLYELVRTYNKSAAETSAYADAYQKENDYLLKNDTKYIETILKPGKGFFLDYYPNLISGLDIPIEKLKKIPSIMPAIDNENRNIGSLEKKLICIKNNMKMKVNLLLFFLNKNLQEKALIYDFKEFGYLNLQEIESLNPHPDSETIKGVKLHLETIYNSRLKDYDLKQAASLPDILIR